MIAGNVIYVMGVSGSGKTTIGKMLAKQLHCSFYDGDHFHPEANVVKMSSGIPLTDQDRLGWLTNINTFVRGKIKRGNVVFACSALKESYREILVNDISETNVKWVWLKCDYSTIYQRMQVREHFMPPSLLKSQFDLLEKPDHCWIIDTSLSMKEVGKQLEDLLSKDFNLR